MFKQIKEKLNFASWRKYISVGALSLYVVGIVMLSVAWASVGVIQKNYKMQKDISVLRQQVDVAQQEADNQALRNKYYASDAYLELAAREHLNKAQPGEKLMIIPKKVALAKLPPRPVLGDKLTSDDNEKVSNPSAWLQFFLGQNIGN